MVFSLRVAAGRREGLGGQGAAHHFPVLVEDVVAERAAQVVLHRIPHEHLVPHLIEIDPSQALVVSALRAVDLPAPMPPMRNSFFMRTSSKTAHLRAIIPK